MLKEKTEADLKSALKQGDVLRVSVIRMFLSSLRNKVIEKRGKTGSEELTEEEVLAVLRSEVKKRRDSIQEFGKGGRQDLIDKETAELKILETYLPEEMPQEELEKIVKKIIGGLGPVSAKDFGKIIGLVMKETKGSANPQLAKSSILKILQDNKQKDE